MTPELTAKLARLKNFHTRYEIVATKDGQKILAGYTARRGRRGLLGMLSMHAAAWTALTGDNAIQFAKRTADGGTMGGWKINFSGRTQREAILGGELPFITKLNLQAA